MADVNAGSQPDHNHMIRFRAYINKADSETAYFSTQFTSNYYSIKSPKENKALFFLCCENIYHNTFFGFKLFY